VVTPLNTGLGSYPVSITGMLGTVPKYATALTNIARAAPASITSPTPGQISSGQSTFTWNSGIGATQYQLAVGSSVGGTNYYSASLGSAQSASVNIPSGASAAYVTLTSLTPVGWLAQSYVYGVPSVLASSVMSLGAISVRPNAPAVTIASPMPSDTITGCSAPVGVTPVIAGVAGSQTVSFTASSAAQLGTTNIACSTAASKTLTADLDVEEFNMISGVTVMQTGPGTYHVSIPGWFGNQGGSLYIFGNGASISPSQYGSGDQDDIEVDITVQDGVCGSDAIEIVPNEYLDPDDGPQSLEADLYLCPDVASPTYTINGQVTVSGSGQGLQGVSISVNDSSGNFACLSSTDTNGNYSCTVNNTGLYTVTPSLPPYWFGPPNRTIIRTRSQTS